MPEKIIRRKYRFCGRVQGVGFRYTAKKLALEYNLTGYVRNETDGTVTMEIQGNPWDIEMVIIGLENHRVIDITKYEKEDLPIITDEKVFYIDDCWNYI